MLPPLDVHERGMGGGGLAERVDRSGGAFRRLLFDGGLGGVGVEKVGYIYILGNISP